MAEIKYEIEKHIGVLSESGNGRPAKYDIRDWTESHDRMTKGITLTQEEVENLVELVKDM